MERHNRTIKNMIFKTLNKEGNVNKWSDIIDGVLFTHRSVRHKTTKYSPFLPYNREPKLHQNVDNFTDVGNLTDNTEKKQNQEGY